jgi:hypothetical protein
LVGSDRLRVRRDAGVRAGRRSVAESGTARTRVRVRVRV